jgi:hypothetical protein
VRAPAIGLIILSFSLRIQAQEQENKLVDRLLRPDMTLQNSAQNKKFATTSVAQDRQVKTKRFFWKEKTNEKHFSDTREFSSLQFHSRAFAGSKNATGVNTKPVHKSDLVFVTQMATNARNVTDAEKKVSSRDFAGNRQFLGKGKSQKALSQQDKPLTIEQVRELLNKNK